MTKTTTYNTVAGLNKTLAKLPKVASAKLRDASKAIASDIASEAAGRARGLGGVQAFVAPSIRATRDRVPKVLMGNGSALPTDGNGWTHSRSGAKQTIGAIIWGAEFGSGDGRFPPHKGTQGYFLWPTVRDRSDETQDRYSEALDDALQALK